LIIFVIAAAFGMIGFLYSFIDFTQPPHPVIALEPFKALTVQEIGGHFLFGFAPAIAASRNFKIGILVGLMALTIDADHLLNAVKLPVQGRLDHSIFFAILSTPLMGWLAVQVVNHNSSLLMSPNIRLKNNVSLIRRNSIQTKVTRDKTTTIATEHEQKHQKRKQKNIKSSSSSKRSSASDRDIFLQFSIFAIAAILSHIAYDIAIDNNDAKFPMLNPFYFGDIVLPRIAAIPIEAGAFLIIIIIAYSATIMRKNSSRSFANTH
jgi:hypothetical protein